MVTIRDRLISPFKIRPSYVAVYSRHRIDISVHDLLYGLLACFRTWRYREVENDVMRACSLGDDGLICFSVRSGFDLLLRVLALPAESELLVSAVTHPDMARIIERHGLRAIPVDLDLETLAPRAEFLERSLTSRTRAVLVAHLFGSRVDLEPISQFAKRHNLLLFEDCAQAFRGPHDLGDPLADVSMFSFGSIKTASAVSGALFRVRAPILRERMRRAQNAWPVQHRRDYASKLLKTLCLVLVSRPLPYRLLVDLCDLLDRDLDALVNSVARAFPTSGNTNREAEDELFGRIRRRPSAPLLALLARRLRTFDAHRLVRRFAAGEEVAYHLPAPFKHPGRSANGRTHWLFPVVAPNPVVLVSFLRRWGFDASRATSNIAAVEPPSDLPGLAPKVATRMMSKILFLPVYPELPLKARRRLIWALEEAASSQASSAPEGSE